MWKRVGKACDRCRMKKSKCGESHPCARCKADDAICIFGKRKKPHDKVYPKGYIEILEQQQSRLVAGLREAYRRLLATNTWPGTPLSETEGHPRIHDILVKLDLIEPKIDESGEREVFEEDCQKLRQRLTSQGVPMFSRQGSISWETGPDHILPHKCTRTSSYSSIHGIPVSPHAAPAFDENFGFQVAPSLPVLPSFISNPLELRSATKPSPHYHETVNNDVSQAPSWQEQLGLRHLNAADVVRSHTACQRPVLQNGYQATLASHTDSFDTSPEEDKMMSFESPQYPSRSWEYESCDTRDWATEPIDVDFSRFVQVPT